MTHEERAELRRLAEAFAETNIVDLSPAATAYFDALANPARVTALLDALDAADAVVRTAQMREFDSETALAKCEKDVAAAEARAALAERQVRVLAARLAASTMPICHDQKTCIRGYPCDECSRFYGDADAWVAWSSAQAGGGDGE